jgi:C-terminal processing protease CtpA/Prc
MSKSPVTFCSHCLSIILICLVVIPTETRGAQLKPGRPAPNTSVLNPDFEQGSVGQVPEGWNSPTSGGGYEAELLEENPKTGKRVARVRSNPATQDKTAPFGNLMQSIDATAFRGRRVRFRAAVRNEGAGPAGRAQLWMRVDRSGSQAGFFDNMSDRPITSGEWRYYEIVGDIDDDAVSVNIGMMLMGTGRAWLDDVSLTDLGKSAAMEPARPLGKRGLENLTAFTRLLGYVRHFHPSDEAAAADWNLFALEGVRAIEGAGDAADLAQKLQALFLPFAPTLRVFTTGKHPAPGWELAPPKKESALKVLSYRHTGFGEKIEGLLTPYHTERVTRDAPNGKTLELPDPRQPFSADLPGGVSILMPMALYADAGGTLPHRSPVSQNPESPPAIRFSGNDRATRLADVALSWNIFQHFYPYFDVVKADWPQELTKALDSAATDSNEKAFLNTLSRMVAALHDGHGGAYLANEPMGTAPVIFGWVENRLVITKVAPQGGNGLQPGDIVLKVDGKDAAEVLAEREALISGATPQWRRYRSVNELRRGAKDSELRLEVQSPTGNPRLVVLKRNSESNMRETRPPQVGEIKPGIFYLDLDRIKDEDVEAVLPKLEQARGIIFDLRGYPQVSPKLISHLTDKPVESARWLIPIIIAPDQKGKISYDESKRWMLQPIAPRLKAKVAFITDGRAISYAESYMGIIEAYKLAEIVGEPTAGTNGNVNPFKLPGNFTMVWTGMKVLKHDGSQHHGVGIQPTVPVARTIRGVSEGRDEQLEKAIAVVSQ